MKCPHCAQLVIKYGEVTSCNWCGLKLRDVRAHVRKMKFLSLSILCGDQKIEATTIDVSNGGCKVSYPGQILSEETSVTLESDENVIGNQALVVWSEYLIGKFAASGLKYHA